MSPPLDCLLGFHFSECVRVLDGAIGSFALNEPMNLLMAGATLFGIERARSEGGVRIHSTREKIFPAKEKFCPGG